MSTRGGDNSKKAQKYQNTFTFKHNKNSMLTRKIRETPLDHLCKRCLEQLEWRINYRKYKPLTSPAKCIKCEGRNIYKAYRTLCDTCASNPKVCTKCATPVEEWAKPFSRFNDPMFKLRKETPLYEIMKELKVRHKRTVERKLAEGEDLIFDKEKGILNKDTGEILYDLKTIYAGFIEGEDEEEEKYPGDDSIGSDEEGDNDNEKGIEIEVNTNLKIKNISIKEEEKEVDVSNK